MVDRGKRFRAKAKLESAAWSTASFPAFGLQWLQLLLVTPDELDVGDVDNIAGLDTQSPELVGDPARFQKALKPLDGFVS